MTDLETYGTFWEHLEELRRVVIKILFIIACSAFLSFLFYQPILQIFGAPLHTLEDSSKIEEFTYRRIKNKGSTTFNYTPPPLAFPSGSIAIAPGEEIELAIPTKKTASLILLSPLEGMHTVFKICFWVGLVGSSPLWLLILLRYVAPAFNEQLKRLAIPFLLISELFFGLGFLFAYYVTLPLANHYLYNFNMEIGTNFWSLSHYFDYTVMLLLANGLGAELSLILLFMVHFGLLSEETLRSKRRHAIVSAFILGALLTPPDILTQFMVAIPLLLFYELAIGYARCRDLKKGGLLLDRNVD